MDFQKALCKVPYQRLRFKLKSHGRPKGGSINNWIAQLNEINGIAVDGEVSIWKSVLSEVPQGSVLWAIFFFNIHVHQIII